jgi:energy-coupling factor transporter ATP-binding protein EcfA2
MDPATEIKPAPTTAIEVRGLHFHYPGSTGALYDINFSIADGECAAIIGPNGAGKSTLLLHLNGILPETHPRSVPDDAGGVFLFGERVGPHNLPQIRRQIGLLFQEADDQLFCPTVYEDVAFGPQQFGLDGEQIRQRVHRCLSQVGLTGFEQRPPHKLSGGEKRRVCLAGVLACDPKVLVLDEPTSGLDPRGRRELIALLRAIPATRIIATHDLELVVELCSRVIVLDGGTVVAQGPTIELLSNEPLMLRHGLEKPHILQHHHPHPKNAAAQ